MRSLKKHYDSYSAAAFHFYAHVGGAEKYIDKLVADRLFEPKSAGISCPTEDALIAREEVIAAKYAELHDLDTVEQVLKIVDKNVRKALEQVYFRLPERNELEWGEIKEGVRLAVINIRASERQIYIWLSKARRLLALERGLRV